MEKVKPTRSSLSHHRQWASVLSLLVSLVLLGFKFYAYSLTDSQAIFSDALESIVNVIAGVITLLVVVIAAKPPDQDHPYGHGKAESLAASFEGGAITFAGILIIIQSIQTYYQGAVIQEIEKGLWLTVGCGLANGMLGLFLILRSRKLHSEALHSSGAHLMTDALTSIGVIAGLILVKVTGYQFFDIIVAIIFGLILSLSGIKILIKSGNTLLDGHDHKTLEMVAALFEKNYRPGLIHIHFTRVIRSGDIHHIDCHVVVPEFWSVADSHIFSEEFERAVNRDYPVEAQLRIHLDPCRRVYCENCEMVACPIRAKEFSERKPLNNLSALVSPEEDR